MCAARKEPVHSTVAAQEVRFQRPAMSSISCPRQQHHTCIHRCAGVVFMQVIGLIMQMDLDVQLQRCLNTEAYSRAKEVRARRSKVCVHDLGTSRGSCGCWLGEAVMCHGQPGAELCAAWQGRELRCAGSQQGSLPANMLQSLSPSDAR